MSIALYVAIGGALGSLARYAVGLALRALSPESVFPWATLFVNVLGCLAIGAVHEFGVVRGGLSESLRGFIVIGILGGFTTFSAFGLESVLLSRDGNARLANINILAQVVLGLAAVIAGAWLVRVSLRARARLDPSGGAHDVRVAR